MINLFVFACALVLVGCTNQTGVRTAGSPHMVNKATGNAIIAVMIKDFDAAQEAAKAQSVDALKGSVAATGSGNADSAATVTDPTAAPTLPPAPVNELDKPAKPLELAD